MGQKNNIIFLDEHGVIVSRNAMIFNSYVPPDRVQTHEEMVNIFAVRMINNLALQFDAQFVSISSVRRNYSDRNEYAKHLSRMGIDGNRLHPKHWQICNERDIIKKRHLRIQKFLDTHRDWINDYLIIDDIPELSAHFDKIVVPNSRLGFTALDYHKALSKLGLPHPKKLHPIVNPK